MVYQSSELTTLNHKLYEHVCWWLLDLVCPTRITGWTGTVLSDRCCVLNEPPCLRETAQPLQQQTNHQWQPRPTNNPNSNVRLPTFPTWQWTIQACQAISAHYKDWYNTFKTHVLFHLVAGSWGASVSSTSSESDSTGPWLISPKSKAEKLLPSHQEPQVSARPFALETPGQVPNRSPPDLSSMKWGLGAKPPAPSSAIQQCVYVHNWS